MATTPKTSKITIRRQDDNHYVLIRMPLTGYLPWHWWTGSGWTKQCRDAKVYEAIVDAHNEYQAIMERMYEGKRLRTFEVTVRVELRSDEHIPPDELQMYLENSTRFSQDTERCGHGPGDSLVLQRVDYTTLREVP